MIELRASLRLALLAAVLATASAEASSPIRPSCEPQGPDTLYEKIPSFSQSGLKQQLSKDLTAAADLLRIGDLPQARVALSQARLAATYLALPRLLPTPNGMTGLAEGSIHYPGLGIHHAPGPQIEVSKTFRSPEGDIPIRVILWEGDWFSIILKLDRYGDHVQSINVGKRSAQLVVGHGAYSPDPCATVVFAVDPKRQVWVGPKCSSDKDANARAALALAERLDPAEIAHRVETNLLSDDFLDDLIRPDKRFQWQMGLYQGTPLVNVVDRDGLLEVEYAIHALFKRTTELAENDQPLASRAVLDDLDELIESLVQRQLYDCLPATIDWPDGMKMPPYDADAYHDEIFPACRRKGPPTFGYSATRHYKKDDLYASIKLSSEAPFDGALLSSKDISVRPMTWDGLKGRYGDRIDIEVDSRATGEGHRKLVADQVDLKCLARVVAGQALR